MGLIEKISQTEIIIFRALCEGSAVMQHMEDFYYFSQPKNVMANCNHNYRVKARSVKATPSAVSVSASSTSIMLVAGETFAKQTGSSNVSRLRTRSLFVKRRSPARSHNKILIPKGICRWPRKHDLPSASSLAHP
ncbi:hypothetical protein V6N13_036437 [Hibiscus sabdariffa]